MKDYRIKIHIRNDRLLSAIENKGYPSVLQFCETYDLPYVCVSEIIRGVRKPIGEKGKLKSLAKELLDILNLDMNQAFTSRQLQGFRRASYEASVTEKQLKQLVSPVKNQEVKMIEKDISNRLNKILKEILSPRDEQIIKMYYGLDGQEKSTMTAIGNNFNVSNSRVQQIIRRTERKLKHPSNFTRLMETGFAELFGIKKARDWEKEIIRMKTLDLNNKP